MSHLIAIHDLAHVADGFLAQITSVAFCARMTAKELDRDGQVEVTQAILSAIETLALAAQQAVADLCADQEALAQQMAQEGAE